MNVLRTEPQQTDRQRRRIMEKEELTDRGRKQHEMGAGLEGGGETREKHSTSATFTGLPFLTSSNPKSQGPAWAQNERHNPDGSCLLCPPVLGLWTQTERKAAPHHPPPR